MNAVITAIASYLPEQIETTHGLATRFENWNAERMIAKTGIRTRHIAAADECSSDLGVRAAERLFAYGTCKREDIDYLILCTQTPDYILPTTACLMQNRLGLTKAMGALDINLGCSGYIYGLSLAKGLIESGQARNVLFVTAETYSKLAPPNDRNVRTIFGDAAAATLVQAFDDKPEDTLGPFVFGTDGSGAENLIVRTGGFRSRSQKPDESPSVAIHVEMNGPEIFNFTLDVVPPCVANLLGKTGLDIHALDMIVPHQANKYMLEHLRDKLNIPAQKFFVGMEDCGNTVSASIPLALQLAAAGGLLRYDARVMLVGFGVGYSWASCLIRWRCAVSVDSFQPTPQL